MISKRRGLMLLGTTALCLAMLGSNRVADSGLTHWMSVFGELKDSIRDAFDTSPTPARKIAEAKRPEPKTAEAPADAIEPSVDKPETRDGAAFSDPHTLALADDKIRALGFDPANILETIAAYRSDNIAAGDAIAAKINDPTIRAALEWVALREVPQKVSLTRLQKFAADHPDWPAAKWLRNQMEAKLFRLDPITVETFFTAQAPETPLGKLALAKALKATGRIGDGSKLARAVFRESDLTGYVEGVLKTEFGADLTKGDYKYRADRLLYKEKVGPALHFAAQAGSDVLALAKARAAVITETSSDKAFAAVPDNLRKDPGLILAEVQKLRRSDKLLEAARLMESAPREPTQLIDGDQWWTERRVLARKLLDAGKINAAYIMCATNSAASPEAKIEAEFHAGWIALRFMNDPTRATYHFNGAAKLAQSPSSVARIAYWQGRTAESSVDPATLATAKTFYQTAARFGSTYYGQLARQILGTTGDPMQEANDKAVGDERTNGVRVIELLYAAGATDSAYALAVAAAGSLDDSRQIGALSDVIAKEQDAHLALTIGKLIGQRGLGSDELAFPTYGIPSYEALANSAATPVVYSIARQESAFMPGVVSRVGAKGLMQMMDATAKHTATKAGLSFDAARMLSDPSFNAKLGAAHLGELISENGGSLILTFAAYNAGGGRVKQWIDAYGDPRKPGVDPVDWVERIPFTETRNYVQRVMANVGMYEAIFADQNRKAQARTVARASRQARL